MSGVVKFLAGAAIMFAGVLTGNLALAKAGFYLANLGLMEEASKLFMPKPPERSIRQDVEYSGTVTPRRIIYGKLRVGGLNTIRPIVTGSGGKLLQQVLTIAGHPCNAVSDVFFNQSTLGTRTAITGVDADGKVTTGVFKDVAWVRVYTGAQTTVDFKLNDAVSSLWTSNHVGRGLTYAALTFQLDENAYGSGKPQVTFLVEGKTCYDPRLDSSPGANPTNASYIAYTTNPALQLADYLMDANLGCGVASTKIDWTLVVSAANICDELVSIPGSTTQKRYTSSVVLDAAGSRREDNIKALAGAMMGICYRQGGKYRMWAGAAQTSSFTLTEADIVGAVSFRRETPLGEKYNFVRGTFTDAARQYQEVEFEPRSNAAYETDDGLRIPTSVTMETVTNAYEAQRNATIVLRRSRMRETLTARFALSAFKVRPFAIGTMTFADIGWSAQRVVCTSWRFVGDGTIEMTLQEDSSTIWDDPTVGSYTAPGSGGSATEVAYTPDPPDNLAATPHPGAILLTWDMPLALLAGDKFSVYEYTSSTPFASATKVWSGQTTSCLLPKNDVTTRYYWVRVEALNGNASSTEPASTGVSGYAMPSVVAPITDPFFQLATDQTYWKWYGDDEISTATNVSISSSGGTVGGKLVITGDGETKYIYANRTPMYPAVTGQTFKLYVRWRRTGTIGGTDTIYVDGSAIGGLPPASYSSAGMTGDITISSMNSATVNQWKEASSTVTVTNLPKNQAQLPFVAFYIVVPEDVSSGTIEIDSFVVTPT